MGRTAGARFVERTGRASCCFDNVGALCLIAAPFAISIMLHSLPTPLEECFSDFIHIQQPFILTPACTLLMCILLLVVITAMGRPYTKKSMVPSYVLHLPFNPVHVATFTAADPCIEEVPVLSRMARSSSHPCLASSHHMIQKASTRLLRSPSHSTFLTGVKPMRPRQVATENLSDEELNRRFSAFIESRLAAMKREMEA